MRTRRHREIEAAIAAYNATGPDMLLPPEAVQLLTIMFPRSDMFQCSLSSLGAEGFGRKTVTKLLKRLIDTDFLGKEPGRRGVIGTYRLHLPPVRR
jgi:hypothetical protein